MVDAMSDSIWDNVAFDHTAADEAIGALERAAKQLDQASNNRGGRVKHAREDWSGATRAEFDQAVDPALRQAGDLADALRRAVGTIRQAATDATTEQRRRLKERDEHRARGGMRPM